MKPKLIPTHCIGNYIVLLNNEVKLFNIMAQYALCYICGKATRVKRAKTCLYCGKYVCKDHRFNGLCPNHTHTMSKEHSSALNRLDILQDIITRIAYWVGVFSFIGIFAIFFGDNPVFGYISLGVFVTVVGSAIIIFRVANKKRMVILQEVNQKLIGQRGSTMCMNCQIRLPVETRVCPKCGGPIMQHTSTIPSESPFSSPAITIASTKLPTPPPPKNQSTTYLPPPPPSSHTPPPPSSSTPPPHQSYTSNQDINDVLEEIARMNPSAEIKVTSFYDEASDSGFHVCSKCGMKFETKNDTSRCPYCNEPLYGTR